MSLTILALHTLLPLALQDAQGLPSNRYERIDRIAQEALDTPGVQALAAAALVGPDLVLREAWGMRNPIADGRSGAAAAGELFRAGAVVEPLTAILALRLVRSGELELDAEVGELLPEFDGDAWKGLRIEHLLTHTSGLPSYLELAAGGGEAEAAAAQRRAALAGRPLLFVIEWARGRAEEGLLGRIAAQGPTSTPGTCFQRSPSEHLLLGTILERSTGSRLAELLEREVFRPAGLERTAFRAHARAREAGAGRAAGAPQEAAGAAPFDEQDLYSDVRELASLVRAIGKAEVLDAQGLELLRTPYRLSGGRELQHGHGVDLVTLDRFEGFAFGGALGGSNVHLAYYPGLDLAIAVAGEGAAAPLERFERRLARAVFDLAEAGVQDWPLEEGQRASFVGEYRVGCTAYDVFVRDGRLTFGGGRFDDSFLLYQGADRFVLADRPEVVLSFERDEDGVRGFSLADHGLAVWASRFERDEL